MTNGSCDELFASWLAAREGGDNPDFEALCAAHAECAEILRALHTEWGRVEIIFDNQVPSRRLDDQSGLDDPGLLLVPPVARETAATLPSLFERLRKRGSPKERFVVKERIGSGGMGAVFRVYDSEIGRHVAAKVLHRLDPHHIPRFLEEAQITGQLDHPAFIPVHDFALDEKGRAFFTMKLVKGLNDNKTEELSAETLHDVIEKIHGKIGGWNLTRGLNVILRVAEAMEFAHVKGVVHRDLKPANILVGRYGEVYVTDFGIARVQGKEREPIVPERPTEQPSSPAMEPGSLLTEIRTERRDAIERGSMKLPTTESPDSPGPTEEGSTIGTLQYMPPEQGTGRLTEIGPHSDIYALGATLYHMIAGVPSWHANGHQVSRDSILRNLIVGEKPTPLLDIAPETPAELVAIVEHAMEFRSSDRYASMRDFATDLRSYLEGRVVSAYETGAIAELKKWVRRNPALSIAAGILLLVLVGATVIVTQQKGLAESRKEEFDQLAGVVLLERAIQHAKELYPPWPEKLNAMEQWLAVDAKRLLDLKPTLERTLAGLRSRVIPRSSEQLKRERESHPKYAELESQYSYLAWLRRCISARVVGLPRLSDDLLQSLEPMSALELNNFAWEHIAPVIENRTYGGEGLALAAAERAVAKVEAGDPTAKLHTTLETLAWAFFVNGLGARAKQASARVIETAPEGDKAAVHTFAKSLQVAIALQEGEAGEHLVLEIESKIAKLEAEIDANRPFSFATEAESFLHSALSEIAVSISNFESNERSEIEMRLAWAKQVEELTLRHPNARVTWDEARSAILKADDVVASRLYAESPLGKIDLEPQIGFIPIGMNPATKLWEFYDLRSGFDPNSSVGPRELEIPNFTSDGSGRVDVESGMGMIFVLLPGAHVQHGAQSLSKSTSHFDPNAQAGESIDGVLPTATLRAFFISKYEMTQGQALRLTRRNPSQYRIGQPLWGGSLITETHPLENIAWNEASTLLRTYGLDLPTEAQWEYACRAGSITPWWTGPTIRDLAGAANLCDITAARSVPDWPAEPSLDDGFVVHCPVGSFRANDFGLHDTVGNVWEWCRDGGMSYETEPRIGDGARYGDVLDAVVIRGAGFTDPPLAARSAFRVRRKHAESGGSIGIRPVRELR